jgi:diguanylate cyclase (GGDEF)-like protein
MRESPTAHLARSRRLLVLVGFVLIGGMWAYSAWSILDLRRRAWDRMQHDAATLLDTGERALARDIELYDLSLRMVAERVSSPVLDGVAPEVRQLALFDRLSQARGYGSIFVLDERGRAFLDSGSIVPRRLEGADRLYFTTHRDNPDAGLFIGNPWIARISHREMIPLSRRFAFADGSFAGVIVGAIDLQYFRDLFDRLKSDPSFAVTLQFGDGSTAVSRHEPSAIPNGDEEPGFVTTGQVGQWPMHVAIAVPASVIRRAWVRHIPPIVGAATILSAGVIAVLWLLGRELTRRVMAEQRALAAQAEFERLAATDALTGLGNRRRFEATLASCSEPASRPDWALLLLDTDYFKRFNDRYGHPAGDHALQRVGAVLAEQALRGGGSAYRVGGEEFALLVPRPEGQALMVADNIRMAVAALALPHAEHPRGILTVSIGLAHGMRMDGRPTKDWLKAADEALYAAKRQGRDRICLAKPDADTRADALRGLVASL